MNRYNACVFAYGQTSSGKTFTMGSGSHLVPDSEVGLIPRAIAQIFERVERESAPGGSHGEAERGERGQREGACCSTQFRIRCQFLEIHNEEVKDLLDPSTSSSSSSSSSAARGSPSKAGQDLGSGRVGGGGGVGGGGMAIRENAAGTIVVTGATEEVVETKEDVMRLLEMGSASRTTGDTRMNAQSSRSHAIFTIILDQDKRVPVASSGAGEGAAGAEAKEAAAMETERISAKFHLVDLAGSERQKKTGATGKRFKESVTINRGLLALGNVISALSKKHMHKHVPYRESKLTRMLQDSIGGNSRTLMIACVSTSDTNMEETLNTLKYAASTLPFDLPSLPLSPSHFR